MQAAQKYWHTVSITVAPDAAEAIEFAFNTLDSLGTEINNLRRDQTEDVKVTGYFDNEIEEETLSTALDEALRIYGFTPEVIKNKEHGRLENADWLHTWKMHWKPTEAGRFIVTPPWEKVTSTDKIVIEIEPAMAFGTGTHDTTRLCLEAIGGNYAAGQTFLDVGTGTGILAIAAAKMGATGIVACDTDAASIENARLNAVMNGVGDSIEFFAGSITGDTPAFDFVCANLTLDVIAPLLPLLLKKSRVKLVLSGILEEQESAIVSDLLRREAGNFEVFHSGEWISVVVGRF
jgi:ribosomal protein L11 methyltransferase